MAMIYRVAVLYTAICRVCVFARRLIFRDRPGIGPQLRPLRYRVIAGMRAAARGIAVVSLAVLPLASAPARADVASSMDGYFNDMGAAANVTGPTAFQGQSAGYYSLGNVWTRFPQKQTSLANLQLPGARAGCGGIDLFAGSFSFINSAELIALLKSVANNAVGFAFKLAIDTVCPECSKVMEEMSQKAQLMNNQGLNSCQMAAGLVGSVWPKGDMADREICQQFGNSSGIFSDMAAAMAGCGLGGRRTSTLDAAAADPGFKDVNPGVPRNYTWEILKTSPFFAPAGTVDEQLAEYVMTMVGTIIYVPARDAAQGSYNPIEGDTSSTLVTALLDGTAGATPPKIWKCDDADKCLNPTLVDMPVATARALRPRVTMLLDGIVTAMTADTPITADQKALLQVASLPLYKILSVQAASSRGLGLDDRQTLAEITAVDLLLSILDQLTAEVGRSRSSFIAADETRLARWADQYTAVKQALAGRQALVQARVSGIMQVIQHAAFLESTLAASMTPAMSASIEWSRAVPGRGL